MRVKLSDPALVDDLVDFLRDSGSVAQPAEEAIVSVSIPKSLREDAAELELDLYLRVWEATHPAAEGRRLRRLTRVDLEAAKGVLDGDQAGAWLKWCCLDDAKDGSCVSQDELERLIPAFERVFERPGELVSRGPFLAFVLGVEGAQAAGEPADAAPG